ncbi:hepatitis A virus cellular receptor 1-like [Gordionus sp. m RMFG-2023]|uniref:hepatitis A virus cellular receptor 1-like n=1 Tax=Gordionus sp. m RMFG-2023 TaxID=3053472 RepID=UPI0031FD0FA5
MHLKSLFAAIILTFGVNYGLDINFDISKGDIGHNSYNKTVTTVKLNTNITTSISTNITGKRNPDIISTHKTPKTTPIPGSYKLKTKRRKTRNSKRKTTKHRTRKSKRKTHKTTKTPKTTRTPTTIKATTHTVTTTTMIPTILNVTTHTMTTTTIIPTNMSTTTIPTTYTAPTTTITSPIG